MGVSIFFTFYGLSLLKRRLNLKVTPLGNPAMPMKLPIGPGELAPSSNAGSSGGQSLLGRPRMGV